MELEISIKLTNGGDSESAPYTTYSIFNYNREAEDSELYERIITDILAAVKEHSS